MDYPASTLVRVKGKWYVSVTVPKLLEPHFKTKQLRLSTGTSDKRLANSKQHSLAASIYARFDTALRNEAATAESRVLRTIDHFQKLLGFNYDVQELKSPKRGTPWSGVSLHLNQLAQTIIYDDMLDADRWSAEQLAAAQDIIYEDVQRYLAERFDPERLPCFGNNEPIPTVKDLIENYLDSRPWERQQSKNAARRQLESFAHHLDNPSLPEITKKTAYKFSEILVDKEKKAQKTIQSYLSAITVFLKWCEKQELIESNPFVDLDLAHYGRKSESWLPLTKPELTNLFKIPNWTKPDRLLLTLLITTGMRLDEAASLSWEQFHEVDGIRYFELSEAQVKNKASARQVVLPDCVELPPPSIGRLFSYRLDIDNKASREASKLLMPKFRKAIGHERKTIHSLRGTLKDLLRDSDVPKETNDYITGHSQNDVVSKYGVGPSLRTKFKAVNSVEHPWLFR